MGVAALSSNGQEFILSCFKSHLLGQQAGQRGRPPHKLLFVSVYREAELIGALLRSIEETEESEQKQTAILKRRNFEQKYQPYTSTDVGFWGGGGQLGRGKRLGRNLEIFDAQIECDLI